MENTGGLENDCQVSEEDVEEPSLVFLVSPHVEVVHAEHEVGEDGQHYGHHQH